MKKLFGLLTLVGLFSSGICLAQNDNEKKVKVGSVAPDIEAKEWINAEQTPPSLAEVRGMVVVLYFWVSFHPSGEQVMPLLVSLQHQALFGRTPGLMIMGVTDADRKQIEGALSTNKIRFPVAVGSEAYKEYEIDNYPFMVIIDPEGRVAYRGSPSSANEVQKQISDVYEKIPPWKTHPSEAVECNDIMTRVRELVRQKNYQDAYTEISNGITKAVIGDKLKADMQVYVDLIEQLAYDRLATVMPLIEQKKFKDAYVVIRSVGRQFKGTPAGRDALALSDLLSKRYDDYRIVAGSGADEDAAARLLAQAREDIANRRFGPGHDKLKEITSRYAFSEAAESAQQVLVRMEKNKGVMAYVDDFRSGPECDRLLGEARSNIRAKRFKEARETLNKIIRDYPNTRYADDAIEELKKLP